MNSTQHAMTWLLLLAVGGAENWRNIQWPFGELRFMDEYSPSGSHLHIKGQ
jgi:hypothetical protein